MSDAKWSPPTRRPLPLILIRGFGGLGVDDEKRVAYQGFNDGTVYPNKRGDNYIYEGMILKFMKSAWQYQDATNVVGYFPTPVIDPAMALSLRNKAQTRDASRTLWVFRYYDLNDRSFRLYGDALVRLIDFI